MKGLSSASWVEDDMSPFTSCFEDRAVFDAHVSSLLVEYDGLPTGPAKDTFNKLRDWPLFERDDELLQDALADVDGSPGEAKAEAYPIPTTKALGNARRIVRFMYGSLRRRIEAYPTPNAEIAVVAPGCSGRSVMVLCESEGGALVTVNLSGNHRRARYSQADTLPDAFLREALADLDP